MTFEDALSRLPPKMFAPAPLLKFANKNTIWLRWDPVLVNSSGDRLKRGEVTYILYARGGYEHLERGARIVVKAQKEEGGKEKKKKKAGGRGSVSDGGSLGGSLGYSYEGESSVAGTSFGGGSTEGSISETLSLGGGEERVEGGWYPGAISGVHMKGTFDIKYDGGGKEKRVGRDRIRKEQLLEWEVVYRGMECEYAVEASVPDVVLEREEGVQVEMEFVLQTLGTEYPVGEPSLHGEQKAYSTINRDVLVKGFMDLMEKEEKGVTDQESRAKKKIMEAIEIDGGVVQSWYKGKEVTGVGMGTHFV